MLECQSQSLISLTNLVLMSHLMSTKAGSHVVSYTYARAFPQFSPVCWPSVCRATCLARVGDLLEGRVALRAPVAPTPLRPLRPPPTSMRQADSHPDRISRARTIVFRVLLVLFVVGRHAGSHRYSDFRGFIWTYKQQDSFTSAYIIGIGIYITNTNILAGCAPKAWRRPEL